MVWNGAKWASDDHVPWGQYLHELLGEEFSSKNIHESNNGAVSIGGSGADGA